MSISSFLMLSTTYAVSDEQRFKERFLRIQKKYTAPGDFNQFAHKLREAERRAQSPEARFALAQIIVWREDLRPTTVLLAGSSIPRQHNEQQILPERQREYTTSLPQQQPPSSPEQAVPPPPVPEVIPAPLPRGSEAVYQLTNGSIDIAKLQQVWLQRVNEIRVDRGRSPLMLHPLLHKTAADRSEIMKRKGVADHRRFAHSAYYAYGELVNWFADRGVVFTNVSRATFTENIGRARFTCPGGDCTQQAIDAMRTTFDFYVREEGTKNDAHRRTMIHPLFQIIGLGIAVDESAKKFYLTTHYGTEIK